MAKRIAPLGWHIPPEKLVSLAPALRELPVEIVFDHLGRIAPAEADRHWHTRCY